MNTSPFVGIFCRTTDSFILAPPTIIQSERKSMETILQNKIIYTSLAKSPLLGVLSIANQSGVVVPQIVEPSEIQNLKQQGIDVLQVKENDALGNLLSVNDKVGFCSPLIPKPIMNEIAEFLKIKIIVQKIANSDLVGSNMVINNRGFVCNPTITNSEFSQIQKHSGLKGNKTSANFGDPHIANSICANQNGALVGPNSTPHEMFAIDEALSGNA